MKTNSTHQSNPTLSQIYITDNCDCMCHYPEEFDINDENSIFENNPPPQQKKYVQSTLKQKLFKKKTNSDNFCVCDKICSCECHNTACSCCPCVKEKASDYYKNLYSQIKSELEIEKRRSERMKFDKEMNKENFEKEKKNLILENTQLKKQLSETITLLEREEEKNAQRDEEVFNYQNDELPKLQQSYENLIKSIKEEKDKQLNEMNNKILELSKENLSLKYQIEKNESEKIKNVNQIIEELNIEITELKNELESKNSIIDKLNGENEELNSHCEEIKSKYNKEIQELRNKNMILNQNINLNLSEIKKFKDELTRIKKNKSNDDQIFLKLKTGNENKDNEINNLKRLLIEKEDEIETLANELEKLKKGYDNLNINFTEAAGRLESFSDLEQRYNSLLQEYNKLKKENNENKNISMQNAKIVNALKIKLSKSEDNVNCLINEKENLKQEIIRLNIFEKKFNEVCDENEELKLISDKYDNLKREYDLLINKLQKKNIVEKEKKINIKV